MKQIADEKNIPYGAVLETVETALAAAYRKDFGNKNQNIKVEFDPEKYDGMTGGIRVFDVKNVVEDMELDEDYFTRFELATAPKKDKPFVKGEPRPQEGRRLPVRAPRRGGTQGRRGEDAVPEVRQPRAHRDVRRRGQFPVRSDRAAGRQVHAA